ncbi:integrase catalytic domain-containing protein [Trichonephila clavipes]|nr:integrase catalytic domain-containing protein [Trichonephila clavipes]
MELQHTFRTTFWWSVGGGVQIEAVFISRPICPLSNDPNDVETLTPAHFLVGSSLVAVPDPDYTEIPMNRLSRWQLVQRMNQHF